MHYTRVYIVLLIGLQNVLAGFVIVFGTLTISQTIFHLNVIKGIVKSNFYRLDFATVKK